MTLSHRRFFLRASTIAFYLRIIIGAGDYVLKAMADMQSSAFIVDYRVELLRCNKASRISRYRIEAYSKGARRVISSIFASAATAFDGEICSLAQVLGPTTIESMK